MDTVGMMKVERPSRTLRELTLEKLRDAIMDQHFKPGDRLVERDLCDKLVVSRTVVREVLRHLEAEGIVEIVPHKGPIVSKPSTEEVREIYEIRGMLEASAAQACAEKRGAQAADKLDELIKNIRTAYASGNRNAVLGATAEFYKALFTEAGRSVSLAIASSLNARVTHLRAMTIGTKGRDREGPDQMQRAVDAIRSGDGDAAYEAAKAHIKQACLLAVELLEREQA